MRGPVQGQQNIDQDRHFSGNGFELECRMILPFYVEADKSELGERNISHPVSIADQCLDPK